MAPETSKLVLLLCALAAAAPELEQPYCTLRYRRLCQGKGRHVACQFPTEGPGESCLNYTMIKFTKNLRNFVTHYINRRRQRLATGNERVRGGTHVPRPEIMMQVEWDRELALLAQRLADQCSFVHDDCRATVRYPYAGQTVGEVKWRRSSESDQQNTARSIRRVLDAWWGERRRVTVKQLTQPFRLTNKGNVWGHFSQLAVWTLRAVGCGAVRHGIKYPRVLLVCDFSHTNMLGQRTIVPGPVGACPIHTQRRPRSPYPLLCAPVRLEGNTKEATKTTTYSSYDAYDFEGVTEENEEDEYMVHTTTAKVYQNITTAAVFEIITKEREREMIDVINKDRERERDMIDHPLEHAYERKQPPPERNRALEIIRTPDRFKGRGKPRERHRGSYKQRIPSTISVKEKSQYANDIDDQETLKQKYEDFNQILYKSEKERPMQLRPMQVRPISNKVEHEPRRQQGEYLPAIAPTWYLETQHAYKKSERERHKTSPFKTTAWQGQEDYRAADSRQRAAEPFKEEWRATEEVTEYYEPVRHRWRPTRDRPDRPGAKALLSSTPPPASSRLRAAKKSNIISVASLMIDKEDVEQLFKDTGFNPSLKNKNKEKISNQSR